MSIVLSARDLHFCYGDTAVLRGVNLTLEEGGLLIVGGLSGDGKSTLLRLLIGLERPTQGVVRLFDKNIARLEEREFDSLKARIGFVFQNSSLLSTLTVEGNLRLPLAYHRLAEGEEADRRVDRTLEMLLIKKYRQKFPCQLSLGIQKRTAMARAIITQPELILMDEPTSGLDAVSRGNLLALISNIRVINRVSMIIITNDLMAMQELDAHIGILKEGELLEPMTYDQLRESPDEFVKSFFRERTT